MPKKIQNLRIFLLLAFTLIAACHRSTLGVCGVAYPFEGEGLPSRLICIKTVGYRNTINASAEIRVQYLNQPETKPEPGVGVLLQFKKPGSDSLVQAGYCDAKGYFKAFLPKGKYDVFFSYSGCNSLLLRNVKFSNGEIKRVDVLLGIQGALVKHYIVNADTLTTPNKF